MFNKYRSIEMLPEYLDTDMIESIVDNVCKKNHTGISDSNMEHYKMIWTEFFNETIQGLLNKDSKLTKENQDLESYRDTLQEDNQTRRKNVSRSDFIQLYKDRAIEFLEKNKTGQKLTEKDLVKIQMKLEEFTMNFNEEDIFAAAPHIMRIMRDDHKCSAKEYLRGKFHYDKIIEGDTEFVRINVETDEDSSKGSKKSRVKKYELLTEEEKELLSYFGHQTLEALLVHILGSAYYYENSIRVIQLIEKIETYVRRHGSILRNKALRISEVKKPEKVTPKTEDLSPSTPVPKSGSRKKGEIRYPFGVGLLEFLIERGFIIIVMDKSEEILTKVGKNKPTSYYTMKSLYARCYFDPSILPIHMNLPMVAPPVEWHISPKAANNKMFYVSDLEGGYYSSANALERHELLSGFDKNNFTIVLGNNNKKDIEKINSFCSIMSNLQKQPFKVNESFLNNIKNYEKLYVKSGLIYPPFFRYIVLDIKGDKNESMESSAIKSLRKIYNTYINGDEKKKKKCSLSEMFRVLLIIVQEARTEQTIIRLAEAYSGYNFYLPAFVDFRGRMYRLGILHFHERELAKSLMMIGSDESQKESADLSDEKKKDLEEQLKICTANHYKPAENDSLAISRFESIRWDILKDIEVATLADVPEDKPHDVTEELITNVLLNRISGAKEPLLFLSKMFTVFIIDKGRTLDVLKTVPVSRDASASAYQIIAYFLLDTKIAEKTNLISTPTGDKDDIYIYLKDELLSFLAQKYKDSGDEEIYESIKGVFDRKFVKSIFMPMIYGKTKKTVSDELWMYVRNVINKKGCDALSKYCFEFFKDHYPHIYGFMEMIKTIGWLNAIGEQAVVYSTPTPYRTPTSTESVSKISFMTWQDYRVMDSYHLWVYDRQLRKKRRVSLRVASEKRDRRKTHVATFVNFIHQKDAFIAMRIVESIETITDNAPIYTVHDNFISNAICSGYLPWMYLKIIKEMGPPLIIINQFLLDNLFLGITDADLKSVELSWHMRNNSTEFVYPEKDLDTLLTIKIDKMNITATERDLCIEKKRIIMEQYKAYCRRLTGGTFKYHDHLDMWDRFKRLLDGKYCLHT